MLGKAKSSGFFDVDKDACFSTAEGHVLTFSTKRRSRASVAGSRCKGSKLDLNIVVALFVWVGLLGL